MLDREYSELHGYEKWEVIYPAVARALGDVSDGLFLDFGCGDGAFYRFLGKGNFIGVDISEYMIEKAAESGETSLLTKDGTVPFFRDGVFDGAVSNLVFIMMPTYEILQKSMQEISRVLKPNGVFVMSITHPCFVERDHFIFNKLVHENFVYADRNRAYTVLLECQDVGIIDYHRPLEDYINALLQSNFDLENFRELYFGPVFRKKYNVSDRIDEYPHYLVISTRKRPNTCSI